MANSFSPTISLNLSEFSSEYTTSSLSPVVLAILQNVELSLAAVVIPSGGLPISDGAGGSGGPGTSTVAISGNIVYKSESATIHSDNMMFTDASGNGAMSITSKTGYATKVDGWRCGIENNTENFTIAKEKSGYVWTNTGSAVEITGVLPSGAPAGMSAWFIRTSESLYILPSGAQIFIPESGTFRDTGSVVHLASSGASYNLISDGNDNWYPVFEYGSIV